MLHIAELASPWMQGQLKSKDKLETISQHWQKLHDGGTWRKCKLNLHGAAKQELCVYVADHYDLFLGQFQKSAWLKQINEALDKDKLGKISNIKLRLDHHANRR